MTYNSYTPSGNLLSETDAGSRTTTYKYDIMGRRTEVDQPDTAIHGGTAGNVTKTSYYLTGQVKAVWGDQTYATYRIYDGRHRLVELRTYRGLAHGVEPTAATVNSDKTTWQYHSQRGHLVAKRYADNKGPDYTYTAAGRLKTRTWAGGKRTRYDYRRGFLAAVRHFTAAASDTGTNAGNDPATPDIGYTYNNFGEPMDIVTVATAAHPATRIFHVYHSTTRRVVIEVQQIDPDLTFALGASDPGITVDYGVVPVSISRFLHRKADGLLRNTGVDLRHTLSPTSDLDIGSTLAYHNNHGRLSTVTGDFGTAGSAAFNHAYVANSTSDLIHTVTRGTQVTTNSWDGTRDLLDNKENKIGSTVISKYQYGVNAIGQRTSVTASGTAFPTATEPNWNWAYNARGELVSSEHVNTAASSRYYHFDSIGNRTQHRDGTHTTGGGSLTSYTRNQLNQYTVIGALSPAYDDDGNMTAGPLPVAPAVNAALVWNGENRLHEAIPSGGSAVRYHYDALGRRLAKTVGSTRTYWIYDGWNPIAEYTGTVHASGSPPTVTLQKTWLWGTDLSGTEQGAGGVGGLLAMNQKTGGNAGVYYPLYDGNGNIGQYVNNSGTVVARYEYDGFGRSLVTAGTHASLFPHRFSTKYLDGETGLYYYGYRYYDPATGGWPSRDPIGERGGVNLYGFVGNDGIDEYDTLGLEPGGGDTPKAADGREAHRQFGPGTKLSPNCDGKGPITDKFIDHGNHVEVQELKPDDSLEKPGGAGRPIADKQLERQMEAARQVHNKPVKGTVWGWVQEECGKRYRFVKKKGVKWIGKRIPVVGTIVSVGTVPGEIEAKGIEGGLTNAGLDAILGVGTCKGIIEIIIGEDLIEDQ